MMSAISDLINSKMDFIRKWAEKRTNRSLPYYFIPFTYTFVGLLMLIALPSYVFTLMEGNVYLNPEMTKLAEITYEP